MLIFFISALILSIFFVEFGKYMTLLAIFSGGAKLLIAAGVIFVAVYLWRMYLRNRKRKLPLRTSFPGSGNLKN
jgi:hypothetical protein